VTDAAQQPVLYHQGQPISPEMATEQRAALVKDPEFLKAALSGRDEPKNKLLAELFELSRGRQPGAATPAPADAAGVERQMSEREATDKRRVLDTWQSHMRLDDAQRFQVERGQATHSQIAEAKREIARLKKDTEFALALTAGNAEAMDAWSKMHWIAFGTRPVAG